MQQKIDRRTGPMMFIAIENAASAYGYKKKNTENTPRIKRSKTELKRYEERNQKKYEPRQQLAESVGFNPRKDESEGSFLFDARMFAEKRKGICRYGVS